LSDWKRKVTAEYVPTDAQRSLVESASVSALGFTPNARASLVRGQSMSRYPEWQAYRARTGWLLPKFVLTKLMNA
jgi:hypothetical protein